MNKRIIALLDMDAFFSSIEEVVNPSLQGKPIVVGAEIINGIGRGVVSTANYKAREYGIYSSMPISTAWKLAKNQATFLPVNFELYKKTSEKILCIVKKYSQKVEQASIDEFYIDLTSVETFQKAQKVCQKIKKEIKEKEKLTCSVGIGPNKFVSKMAAEENKPDGLSIIRKNNVKKFLNKLEIRKITGIGPKTAEKFYKKNIYTVKNLNKLTLSELKKILGKQGEKIYYKTRGIDNDLVSDFHEKKSIGEQITFPKNTLDALFIFESLKKISSSVLKKLKDSGFSGFGGICITVRFSDFKTITSYKKINEKSFKIEVIKMILPFLDKRNNPSMKPIRLVGLRLEKLKK